MFEFHNDQKLFAIFVSEFPENQELYELWECACLQGNASDEAHLAEKLLFEMRWQKWI